MSSESVIFSAVVSVLTEKEPEWFPRRLTCYATSLVISLDPEKDLSLLHPDDPWHQYLTSSSEEDGKIAFPVLRYELDSSFALHDNQQHDSEDCLHVFGIGIDTTPPVVVSKNSKPIVRKSANTTQNLTELYKSVGFISTKTEKEKQMWMELLVTLVHRRTTVIFQPDLWDTVIRSDVCVSVEYKVLSENALQIAPAAAKDAYAKGAEFIEIQSTETYSVRLLENPPRVNILGTPGQKYTLLLVDLDSLTCTHEGVSSRGFLHWAVMDIPDGDISRGQVLAPYISPVPEYNTGHHRLFFLVFRHHHRTNAIMRQEALSMTSEREDFSITRFTQFIDLREPIASIGLYVGWEPYCDNLHAASSYIPATLYRSPEQTRNLNRLMERAAQARRRVELYRSLGLRDVLSDDRTMVVDGIEPLSLKVGFKNKNGFMRVDGGNFIDTTVIEGFSQPPDVRIDAESCGVTGPFTFVMLSPDWPSHLKSNGLDHIFWLVTNIKDSKAIGAGDIVIPYIPPVSKKDSGLHRIVMLLYKQTDNMSVGAIQSATSFFTNRFGVVEKWVSGESTLEKTPLAIDAFVCGEVSSTPTDWENEKLESTSNEVDEMKMVYEKMGVETEEMLASLSVAMEESNEVTKALQEKVTQRTPYTRQKITEIVDKDIREGIDEVSLNKLTSLCQIIGRDVPESQLQVFEEQVTSETTNTVERSEEVIDTGESLLDVVVEATTEHHTTVDGVIRRGEEEFGIEEWDEEDVSAWEENQAVDTAFQNAHIASILSCEAEKNASMQSMPRTSDIHSQQQERIRTIAEQSINQINSDTFGSEVDGSPQPYATESFISLIDEDSEEVPTKEVPTKEVPTKEVPTKEVSTKEVPTNEAPTNEAPTNEVSESLPSTPSTSSRNSSKSLLKRIASTVIPLNYTERERSFSNASISSISSVGTSSATTNITYPANSQPSITPLRSLLVDRIRAASGPDELLGIFGVTSKQIFSGGSFKKKASSDMMFKDSQIWICAESGSLHWCKNAVEMRAPHTSKYIQLCSPNSVPRRAVGKCAGLLTLCKVESSGTLHLALDKGDFDIRMSSAEAKQWLRVIHTLQG